MDWSYFIDDCGAGGGSSELAASDVFIGVNWGRGVIVFGNSINLAVHGSHGHKRRFGTRNGSSSHKSFSGSSWASSNGLESGFFICFIVDERRFTNTVL